MRRIAATVLVAAMIGCNGSGPEAGGVYVLEGDTPIWPGGIQTGTMGTLQGGSIVRVVEVGTSPAGNAFIRVTVERDGEVGVFDESWAGRSGYIEPESFEGAPTTAP